MTPTFHRLRSENGYQAFVIRLLVIYFCAVACRVISVINFIRGFITGTQ